MDGLGNKKLEGNQGELEQLNPLEGERALWAWLEQADKPIRNILKRLNRISETKFPEYKLRTSSSCSGHINKDGSLAISHNTAIGPIFSCPHIMFFTQDKKHQKEMAEYFRKLFDMAIERANQQLEKEGLTIKEDLAWSLNRAYIDGVYVGVLSEEVQKTHPEEETYAIDYQFPTGEADPFLALKYFWEGVENAMTEVDGFQSKTLFTPTDFIREN